jgi:hypothetical protein
MVAAAECIGLPDCDGYAADRLAGEIEDATQDFDDFTLSASVGSVDGGQVGLRGRRMRDWEIRAENLVRCPRPGK